MADIKTWLAGFTYRGRAPWETDKPDYHVEVGEYVEVEGRDPVNLGVKVLAPDAAKAAGFALPDLLSAINSDALGELTTLRAQTVALTDQSAALREALSKAEQERDEASANLASLKASFAGKQPTAPTDPAA